MNLPDGMPRDTDGPVFREPWEAQAFALTLRLHEAGHFTWTEWAEALGAEIAAARAAGDPDLGDTYYRHWLRALERLLADKGILAPGMLDERAAGLNGETKPAIHGSDTEGTGSEHPARTPRRG